MDKKKKGIDFSTPSLDDRFFLAVALKSPPGNNDPRKRRVKKRKTPKIARKHPKTPENEDPPFSFFLLFSSVSNSRRFNAATYFLIIASIWPPFPCCPHCIHHQSRRLTLCRHATLLRGACKVGVPRLRDSLARVLAFITILFLRVYL